MGISHCTHMLAFIVLLVGVSVAADECCWCGKRYYQGTPSFPSDNYTNVPRVDIVVTLDKGFYVLGLDEQAKLVVYLSTQLADPTIQIDILDNKLEYELGTPVAEIQKTSVFEIVLPAGVTLSSATKTLNWTLAHRSGSLDIYFAANITQVMQVQASRVVRVRGKASLERFSPLTQSPAPFFPYGFFISWPLLKSNASDQAGKSIGNIVHPVSPYDDGDVKRVLDETTLHGLQWMYDMRHVTTDIPSITKQVTQYRSHPGIFSWYISDEPDGAGNVEGLPIGKISPAALELAYRTVKSLDPFHPVSVSLNCQYSAGMYLDGADLLMPDVYPMGTSMGSCSLAYGCCGCDDCAGHVTDVSDRLQLVGSLIAFSKPIHFVGQAFGGTGEHWSRSPSRDEFRIMSYLGMMHGSGGGMSYWLQSDNTSPLLPEARAISSEFSDLSQFLLDPNTNEEQLEVEASDTGLEHKAWCCLTQQVHRVVLANPSAQPMPASLFIPAFRNVNTTATVLVGNTVLACDDNNNANNNNDKSRGLKHLASTSLNGENEGVVVQVQVINGHVFGGCVVGPLGVVQIMLSGARCTD